MIVNFDILANSPSCPFIFLFVPNYQTALSKVVSFFVEFLKKVNNKVIMIKKMYKKSINLRDWIWTSIKNDRPKVFRKSNTAFFPMNLTVRNIDPLMFSTVELMTKYK